MHRLRDRADRRALPSIDHKFLNLAVNGRADLIVSGDADLLALDPFRGIPIVTPALFLQRARR
jgi:uncharacterized protein